MAECKSLQQEYKSLTKNPEIKFWTKYQNKSAYKMYVETSNSTLIADYEELKAYVNSDEFKTQKEYLLDKNRFRCSSGQSFYAYSTASGKKIEKSAAQGRP